MTETKNNVHFKKMLTAALAVISIFTAVLCISPKDAYAGGYTVSVRNGIVTNSAKTNGNDPYVTISYNGKKQAWAYVKWGSSIRLLNANENNKTKPKFSNERFRVVAWLNGQKVSSFDKAGEYVCYVYKYGTTQSLCSFRHWVRPVTPQCSINKVYAKSMKIQFNVNDSAAKWQDKYKQTVRYQFQFSNDPNFSKYSLVWTSYMIPNKYDETIECYIPTTSTGGRVEVGTNKRVYVRVRSATYNKGASKAIYSNWSSTRVF